MAWLGCKLIVYQISGTSEKRSSHCGRATPHHLAREQLHSISTTGCGGIWPLYEVENGKLSLYGKTDQIANRRFKRLPVRDYLVKQGKFAHFTEEDTEFFQDKIDETWDK